MAATSLTIGVRSLAEVRACFPALASGRVVFDNPAGTQVPRPVLTRMHAWLAQTNANGGGFFPATLATGELVQQTRAALAAFLHAPAPEAVVFGANMTTLTYAVSRALAREWQPGDTIVVTRLDHDANISPWLQAAADRQCCVHWVNFDPGTGTLDRDDYARALEKAPRLVALGYASNALGTINPVAEMTAQAHDAGALVYVDAVHYAPHGLIDVQTLDCDFLACSPYKFFGPHLGVLFGKLELLEDVPAYRVRPAPHAPPGKWEVGTSNFEGIAGTLGALEYLQWLAGSDAQSPDTCDRAGYARAMHAVQEHERRLSAALLRALADTPGCTLYGLSDPARLGERTCTYSFRLAHEAPGATAQRLAAAGINAWSGHNYAQAVMEAYGVLARGSLVRVGPVHYNTLDEVARFGAALRGDAAEDAEANP